jgi:hypothetical protein
LRTHGVEAISWRIPTNGTSSTSPITMPMMIGCFPDFRISPPGRGGAPLVGFPHEAHGTNET